MSINPLIALSANAPKISSFNDARAKSQQVEMNDEKLAQAKLETFSERDRARLTSSILGAAELDSHLQGDNVDAARNFLNNRRIDLGKRIAAGENVDTRETDEALEMLDKDPKALKELTSGAIKFGQQAGILKTQQQLKGGADPAALQLTNAYQAALQSGDNKKANAILMFTKSLEKGQTLDADGNIINAPGALDATKNTENAKETGKQTAKLEYEPTIEGNKAKAKSDAEFRAKAQQSLPQVLDNSEYLTDQLDALIKHPGKKLAVGGTSVLPIIPGTDAADFQSRLKQVNGEQFLQAFQSLKGGGQITEIEGEKATDAIARMQKSQSEPEFDKSVKEFQDVVKKATQRARAAAGSNISLPEEKSTIRKSEEPLAASPEIQAQVNAGKVHDTLPQGAKQIGTSGGKPVYQTADGKQFLQD